MTPVGRIALISYVIVGLTVPVTIFYRGTVLERLQRCAREIPTSGSRPVDSPCATLGARVLVLAGISVTQLKGVLGPPQYCFDVDPATGRWRHRTCWAPAWSFYYLPDNYLGGGPNLACWATDGNRCWLLSWMYTA